jgi:hypothetical protein
MDARATPAPSSTSDWGSGFGAGGVLSLLLQSNVDGTVVAPASLSLDDSLDADGTIHLRTPGASVDLLRGCVSTDQGAVLAGKVLAGDIPGIFMATRVWPVAATTADLTGSHHATLFRFDGANAASGATTATFNGTGTATLPAGGVFNQNGVITTSTLASSLPYSVASDGLVTLTTTLGGIGFQGGLHPTREIGACAGSIGPGIRTLFVFVQNATAASDLTFAGDYCMVGLTYDFAAPAFRSFTGHLVSDGLAGGTVTGTTNVEGVIGSTGPTTLTYAVSLNGTLTVTTPDGTFSGGVSPSGDFAVLGGPTTPGSQPAIYVLVR